MKNNKLKDKIKILEIKIRHLKNQHEVVKKQYEKTTREYLKILDDVFKTNKQLQQEIAERKQTEEKLKKYQLIIESAQDAIFFKDLKSRYIFANDKTAEAFGLHREKIIGKNDYELMPNKVEAKKNIEDDQLIITTGKTREITKHMTGADGREYWFQAIKFPLFDDKRNVIGLVGIARDFTDLKKAEEALKESEAKYRILFESSPIGIFIADIETKKFRYSNPAICKMLGYSKEKLQKMGVSDIHPLDTLEHVISEFEAQSRGEKTLAPNIPCLRKDGEVISADIRTVKVLIDGRECNVGFFSDITKRKRAEEELRESEEKYRLLVGSIDTGLILVDKEGNFLFVNENAATVWGKKKEDVIGKNIRDIIPSEYAEENLKLLNKIIKNGKGIEQERYIPLLNKWFIESSQPVKNEQGDYFAVQVLTYDITERKRAEVELKSSREQLRALTEYLQQVREEERTFIAREIHDELGQALTALKMDISWIKRNLPEKIYPLHEKIKSMTELVDKTIQTTKEMSAKLRPSILDDFGLDAAIEWYAKEFQNRTEITCEIHTDLKELILNKNRSTTIFRIFQESLTNVARHADATKVKVNVSVVKSNLVLRIKDNGKGITEKQINDSKSFGLIGMRERLILLTGKLKIYSVKDKGATIVATIPLERRRKSR